MTSLLPALLLRLLGLASSPLWYDEILSLQRARLPFWEHMGIQVSLWEIILRGFAHPSMLRLPALACSMLAIWLAWKITERLSFTQTQRIVALAAMSAMPGLIWMSQDARYYAGVALVYMAALYFGLDGRWLGLFAVSGLSIYVHPVAPAYVIPGWIVILQNAPSAERRFFLWTSLLLPLVWSFRFLVGGGPFSPNFWLDRSDLPYLISQFGLSLGAHPLNIYPALAFVCLALIFAAMRFRPVPWIIFLVPILAMLAVSIVYRPVIFYRTLQPSLMGLALLVGSSVPEGRRAWRLSALAVLLAFMLVNYDPSLHAGHIERGAEQVRSMWQAGDCIQYEDEFSRTAASVVLADLPTCDGRGWTISTTPPAEYFFRTDGWHFPTIYFSK